MPLAGAFLLVQGVVEIIRCVICIQQGALALARRGRGGGRRRQAEGNGAREGRRHRQARQVRRAAGGAEMKIRKELWFGFILMGLILLGVAIILLRADSITNGHLGLLMLGADRGRDHARLPDCVHADGHGHVLRLARLPQREPRVGRAPDARPDGAARLFGDVQRRPDRDSAVRLHGLSGRARQPDREAVQEPAPGAGPRAGCAGGGHHRHLRDLRHGHRHRRRGGHVDGPAGAAGDAARRLQHQARRWRDHRRRLPGHPDPAFGPA